MALFNPKIPVELVGKKKLRATNHFRKSTAPKKKSRWNRKYRRKVQALYELSKIFIDLRYVGTNISKDKEGKRTVRREWPSFVIR